MSISNTLGPVSVVTPTGRTDAVVGSTKYDVSKWCGVSLDSRSSSSGSGHSQIPDSGRAWDWEREGLHGKKRNGEPEAANTSQLYGPCLRQVPLGRKRRWHMAAACRVQAFSRLTHDRLFTAVMLSATLLLLRTKVSNLQTGPLHQALVEHIPALSSGHPNFPC